MISDGERQKELEPIWKEGKSLYGPKWKCGEGEE